MTTQRNNIKRLRRKVYWIAMGEFFRHNYPITFLIWVLLAFIITGVLTTSYILIGAIPLHWITVVLAVYIAANAGVLISILHTWFRFDVICWRMDVKPAFYEEIVPEEFPDSTEEDRRYEREFPLTSWPVLALLMCYLLVKIAIVVLMHTG